MIVLGIDPGLSGGLATIAGPSSSPRIVAAVDMPRDDDGIDANAFISFVQENPPDLVVLERVRAMPSIARELPDGSRGERRSMGATSAFNFGGAYHSARVIVVGLGFEPHKVEPQTWKKVIGITSRDPLTGAKRDQAEVKEIGRQKAISLFRNGAGFMPLKRHHNISEAALIALYGLKWAEAGPVNPRRG